MAHWLSTLIIWLADTRTLFLCVLVFCVVYWWTSQPKNLPPGPWRWPILGSLPNLGISMYRSGLQPQQFLAQLTKHYGKVYSVYLGNQLVIFLNSAEAVREAFQNQYITDRPMILLPEKIKSKGHGVVMASGDHWREQRRFTLSTFRSFGVGKRSFQDQISVEVKILCEEVASLRGESFDPRNLLSNAVSNVICSVVLGKRYEYTDNAFRDLLRLLDKQVEAAGSGVAELIIPILRYLKQSQSDDERYNGTLVMKKFFGSIIHDHRNQFDQADLKDYIDVYLDEIHQVDGTDRASSINEPNLKSTVSQLFAAGSETTVTTLRWAFLYMMGYPEIQSKVQQEIDHVVGRDSLPNLSDKGQMPYTEATLMEVQRIATIVPLGVPHLSWEDTTLFGHTIPKKTIIMANLWAIHHDSDIWEEPEAFRPERFLDGSILKKQPEEYLPFSAGRQVCLGENLAKIELFLFFSHLLHRFTFEKPPSVNSLCYDGKVGSTNAPNNFLTQAVVRD